MEASPDCTLVCAMFSVLASDSLLCMYAETEVQLYLCAADMLSNETSTVSFASYTQNLLPDFRAVFAIDPVFFSLSGLIFVARNKSPVWRNVS